MFLNLLMNFIFDKVDGGLRFAFSPPYTLFYILFSALIFSGFQTVIALDLDVWDPRDDVYQGATMLEIPSEGEGTHGPHILSSEDRYDWFLFTLSEGCSYQFYSPGESFLVGELFYPDGVTLVFNNDAVDLERNLNLLYTPGADGKFLLRVRTLGEENAPYTLHYRMVSEAPVPVVDEWDSIDDTFTGAVILPAPDVSEQTHGPHSLSLSDLYDWFQIVLPAGEPVEFRSVGDSDTVGVLFHTNGSAIAAQDDDSGTGYNFHLMYTPDRQGAYFLRVSLHDPGSTGAYTLQYRSLPETSSWMDEWDPNDDNIYGASALDAPTLDERIHGPHNLSPTDEADWFQVVLEAGILYEFTSSGDADPLCEFFYSETLEPSVSDDDSGEDLNFRIVFTPDRSGLYYLRIREETGEGGAYSLHYRSGAEPSVELERIKWIPFNSTQEFTAIPGGFIQAPGGEIMIAELMEQEEGLNEGRAAVITVGPGQLELLQFPTLYVGEQAALIRVSARSTGAGASIALAALDGSMDGSIATNLNADSALYQGRFQQMSMIYDPPGITITPVFQVFNQNGTQSLSVYLDNLEVYLIPKEGRVPAEKLTSYTTATPVAQTDLIPLRVFSFDSGDEFTVMPGGYINAPGGLVETGAIPASSNSMSDGWGAWITAGPGEVELLQFPRIEAGEGSILLRVSIHSTGPGAAVALAALDGSMDGSIGTNIPADSGIFQENYQRLTLLYDPPGSSVFPILQLANQMGTDEVTVYVDNLEVYLLPNTGSVPAELLSGY